ncbi:hypothetical protein BMETH_72112721378856, partial [methanotrophic bacterial endosymbiont of Bathymodiolus sp.]
KLESAVEQGRSYSFFGFTDFGIGQTDQREGRQAG